MSGILIGTSESVAFCARMTWLLWLGLHVAVVLRVIVAAMTSSDYFVGYQSSYAPTRSEQAPSLLEQLLLAPSRALDRWLSTAFVGRTSTGLKSPIHW